MSRALLVTSVALFSYALISTVAALSVAALFHAWDVNRARSPAAWRARRLAQLRLLPLVVGVTLTMVLVMPGYLAFEVASPYEEVGPLLIALAIAGAFLFVAGLAAGLRAVIATRRLERRWMASAEPLRLHPPAGLPAFAIDSPAPVVALVGVWRPTLLASRVVLDACNELELASIVAHERGHLAAGDNLKRWLMASAPDVLRWMPLHDRIVRAWHDAAEDAADDHAAGERVARANLAALLLKVARLAPGEPWPTAMGSPFADPQGLDRRVRRLLEDTEQAAPAAFASLAPALAIGATLLVTIVVSSATALQAIHEAVETVVGLGR